MALENIVGVGESFFHKKSVSENHRCKKVSLVLSKILHISLEATLARLEISARILHHVLPVITSIRILTARILTIRKLPQHFAQSSDPPASTHKRFYSLWPLWYIQPSCVPPLRRHRRMVKEEPPPIHHYPVRIPFYSGGTDGIDVTPIAARHTTGFILRPA